MSAEVSFRVTNLGTVVVQYGDEVPEPHTCDLPDEAPTGTIVMCEDCGEYWRCDGQRYTGVVSIPCTPDSGTGEYVPKWYKMGLFSMWYYIWRHNK